MRQTPIKTLGNRANRRPKKPDRHIGKSSPLTGRIQVLFTKLPIIAIIDQKAYFLLKYSCKIKICLMNAPEHC